MLVCPGVFQLRLETKKPQMRMVGRQDGHGPSPPRQGEGWRSTCCLLRSAGAAPSTGSPGLWECALPEKKGAFEANLLIWGWVLQFRLVPVTEGTGCRE